MAAVATVAVTAAQGWPIAGAMAVLRGHHIALSALAAAAAVEAAAILSTILREHLLVKLAPLCCLQLQIRDPSHSSPEEPVAVQEPEPEGEHLPSANTEAVKTIAVETKNLGKPRSSASNAALCKARGRVAIQKCWDWTECWREGWNGDWKEGRSLKWTGSWNEGRNPGWNGGRKQGWSEEWTEGWRGGWKEGRIGGGNGGRKEGWSEEWTEVWRGGWKEGRVGGGNGGRKEGWSEEWTEGWRGGRREGRSGGRNGSKKEDRIEEWSEAMRGCWGGGRSGVCSRGKTKRDEGAGDAPLRGNWPRWRDERLILVELPKAQGGGAGAEPWTEAPADGAGESRDSGGGGGAEGGGGSAGGSSAAQQQGQGAQQGSVPKSGGRLTKVIFSVDGEAGGGDGGGGGGAQKRLSLVRATRMAKELSEHWYPREVPPLPPDIEPYMLEEAPPGHVPPAGLAIGGGYPPSYEPWPTRPAQVPKNIRGVKFRDEIDAGIQKKQPAQRRRSPSPGAGAGGGAGWGRPAGAPPGSRGAWSSHATRAASSAPTPPASPARPPSAPSSSRTPHSKPRFSRVPLLGSLPHPATPSASVRQLGVGEVCPLCGSMGGVCGPDCACTTDAPCPSGGEKNKGGSMKQREGPDQRDTNAGAGGRERSRRRPETASHAQRREHRRSLTPTPGSAKRGSPAGGIGINAFVAEPRPSVVGRSLIPYSIPDAAPSYYYSYADETYGEDPNDEERPLEAPGVRLLSVSIKEHDADEWLEEEQRRKVASEGGNTDAREWISQSYRAALPEPQQAPRGSSLPPLPALSQYRRSGSHMRREGSRLLIGEQAAAGPRSPSPRVSFGKEQEGGGPERSGTSRESLQGSRSGSSRERLPSQEDIPDAEDGEKGGKRQPFPGSPSDKTLWAPNDPKDEDSTDEESAGDDEGGAQTPQRSSTSRRSQTSVGRVSTDSRSRQGSRGSKTIPESEEGELKEEGDETPQKNSMTQGSKTSLGRLSTESTQNAQEAAESPQKTTSSKGRSSQGRVSTSSKRSSQGNEESSRRSSASSSQRRPSRGSRRSTQGSLLATTNERKSQNKQSGNECEIIDSECLKKGASCPKAAKSKERSIAGCICTSRVPAACICTRGSAAGGPMGSRASGAGVRVATCSPCCPARGLNREEPVRRTSSKMSERRASSRMSERRRSSRKSERRSQNYEGTAEAEGADEEQGKGEIDDADACSCQSGSCEDIGGRRKSSERRRSSGPQRQIETAAGFRDVETATSKASIQSQHLRSPSSSDQNDEGGSNNSSEGSNRFGDNRDARSSSSDDISGQAGRCMPMPCGKMAPQIAELATEWVKFRNAEAAGSWRPSPEEGLTPDSPPLLRFVHYMQRQLREGTIPALQRPSGSYRSSSIQRPSSSYAPSSLERPSSLLRPSSASAPPRPPSPPCPACRPCPTCPMCAGCSGHRSHRRERGALGDSCCARPRCPACALRPKCKGCPGGCDAPGHNQYASCSPQIAMVATLPRQSSMNPPPLQRPSQSSLLQRQSLQSPSLQRPSQSSLLQRHSTQPPSLQRQSSQMSQQLPPQYPLPSYPPAPGRSTFTPLPPEGYGYEPRRSSGPGPRSCSCCQDCPGAARPCACRPSPEPAPPPPPPPSPSLPPQYPPPHQSSMSPQYPPPQQSSMSPQYPSPRQSSMSPQDLPRQSSLSPQDPIPRQSSMSPQYPSPRQSSLSPQYPAPSLPQQSPSQYPPTPTHSLASSSAPPPYYSRSSTRPPVEAFCVAPPCMQPPPCARVRSRPGSMCGRTLSPLREEQGDSVAPSALDCTCQPMPERDLYALESGVRAPHDSIASQPAAGGDSRAHSSYAPFAGPAPGPTSMDGRRGSPSPSMAPAPYGHASPSAGSVAQRPGWGPEQLSDGLPASNDIRLRGGGGDDDRIADASARACTGARLASEGGDDAKTEKDDMHEVHDEEEGSVTIFTFTGCEAKFAQRLPPSDSEDDASEGCDSDKPTTAHLCAMQTKSNVTL